MSSLCHCARLKFRPFVKFIPALTKSQISKVRWVLYKQPNCCTYKCKWSGPRPYMVTEMWLALEKRQR